MAGIFTRPEITKIINNADLTPEERVDQLFSLYGRAIDDGFVTKKAADAAQTAAIEAAKTEWEKAQQKPNVIESEEYKKLQGEFDDYKSRQTARSSDDFKGVKPKFFDTVYDRIDRAEGAKPISEQIAGLKKDYEEWFVSEPAEPTPPPKFPQFGAKPEGGMPKGDEGAVAGFKNAWAFGAKK